MILGVGAAYFLLCAAIGWWAARRTRTTEAFFVADRAIPLCFKTHTEALQLWFDAKRPPPK